MVERPGEELLARSRRRCARARARGRRARRPLRLRPRARARDALRRPAQPAAPPAPAGRPALEAAGAPPGELAHHFFAAREVGGAEGAVEYGAAAARHAVAAHAYEEAAWHLGQRARRRRRRGAELLLALGDVRWQASEPGAPRRVRRGGGARPRAQDAPELVARAVLGAGGRFYMPTATDDAYIERLRRRSPASATPTSPYARGCSRAWPSTSRSPTPASARPSWARRPSRWRAAPATKARSRPR